MKIIIFSRNAALYSTHRLIQACRRRGHFVLLLDHTRCDLMVDRGKHRLYYNDESITNVSAVIPRIGSSATAEGEVVIRHLETAGLYSTTSADGLLMARNKFRAYQILASHDILVPRTILSGSIYSADTMLALLGDPPYIIKLINSTHGAGVLKAENDQMAMAMIDAFSKANQSLMIQEYIAESSGEDIRVFIVGDEVVACMKRTAALGDFRSNLHRGGRAEQVPISDHEKTLARDAARILKLDVAGVDILRSSRGPMILEVNASPGLEGIEASSRVDIAGKIVEMIENKIGHT